MDPKIDYRQEGYQQGYKAAKITSGKISKKYQDTLFESTENNLTSEKSCEFITGWHDGCADYMAEIFRRIVHEEGLVTKCLSDIY
jgi:hypothetical protein